MIAFAEFIPAVFRDKWLCDIMKNHLELKVKFSF